MTDARWFPPVKCDWQVECDPARDELSNARVGNDELTNRRGKSSPSRGEAGFRWGGRPGGRGLLHTRIGEKGCVGSLPFETQLASAAMVGFNQGPRRCADSF